MYTVYTVCITRHWMLFFAYVNKDSGSVVSLQGLEMLYSQL